MTELPNGWQKVRFGDIFKVKYGKAIDKALRKESARYPVVGSAGIMTYTDEPLSIDPTIVIGRKGNVGSIQIFEHGCYPIDTTYYMQPASQFDIKFLTLLLTSLELVKLDSSTATPSLRREDLENVSFFVPPFPEQQKIVETLDDHLSRLDAALADVKQAKLKAAQFRRSLLQAAFTGNLSGDGTCVMTAWKTKKVGELADTQLGKMLNKNKQTGKHSHPYLRSLNVQWGKVELSDLNEMDILPEEYEKFTLRQGDLLICEGGESGRAAIWNSDTQMGFQNALHRVRAGSELSNKYLFYYFEWLVKNQLIEHLFNGVTIKHFPQENLRSVEVSYPPLPEQQKIVEILEDHLSRLGASVAIADAMEKQSASLRRSLLQAAFTGQLTKEVASV